MEILEKQIIPCSNQGMKLKYPWDKMNVGDGFNIKCEEKDLVNTRSSLLGAAKSYASYHSLQMKFVTRRTDNGISIWRIK